MQDYHNLLKTGIELYTKLNLDIQRKDLYAYACKKALKSPFNQYQYNEFENIFKINNICILEFALALRDVLIKRDPKINCLRIIGTPNSGKTLIANCIVTPFICCYNNNHGSENEFYLSNMLNKSIILCEELYITIATCEDMKSVLAGQCIDIAKKFNEKQLLSRTPVIITSNYAKFGRGHLAPCDETALALRCHTFRFNNVIKPTCMLEWQQFYHFIMYTLDINKDVL